MRICVFATPGFTHHDILDKILTPYMSAGPCEIYYRTMVLNNSENLASITQKLTSMDDAILKTDACIKGFALRHRLCYAPFVLQTASQLLRMKHMFDYVVIIREYRDETLDKFITLIKLAQFRVFNYTYNEEELHMARFKKKFNKVCVLPTIRE